MRNKREYRRHAVVLVLAVAGLIISTAPALTSAGLASAEATVPSDTGSTNTATLRANGKIAFASDRDGNREIYVMNADGTNQVRLTNNSVVDDHPTWSPDGTKIAFVSQRASGGFAIFVMNADGTNNVEITPIVFNATAYPIWDAWGMSWSPDGHRIVFQEKVEPSPYPAYPNDIFIVNVESGNKQILVDDPVDARQPSWSPDGSKILFVSQRVGAPFYHNLYTIRPDGSDLQPLAGFPGETDIAPTWSPTGDKIAFQIFDYANFENIGIANADGSGRFWFDSGSVGPDWGGRDKPDWSPDGNKMVFHVSLGASGTWDTEIFIKNIDGTGLTQVTDTNGNNFKPSWQPIALAECPNPIDCAEFFVRQHYLDFLNREPDPAGDAAWQAVLNDCLPGETSCDRIHVSSAFFRSPEFQGRGYFVYRFYPVSFGRKPDYDEFTPDLAKVSGFLTDAELEAAKLAFIAEFMNRPAFLSKFNGLSNAEYVDTLLLTADVGHPNRDTWIAALTNGSRTRAQVLREIAESTEAYNKYYNQAFVVMQYFGYLKRQPDALYLTWIAHLDATGDYRSMINGFVNSIEYRARFGP